MGEESEQLRRDIEQTRRELGVDVDAVTEKVSPKRVVGRRVDRAKHAVGGLKEKVMGTTADAASSTGQGLSTAASSVGDSASSAAAAARRGAEGNPLAAGVIAFGVGWLISSLLPASRPERQVATKVKDEVQPALQPAAQQAGEALSEVKDNLREPAQQAAQSLRATAADAAENVKQDARSSASEVEDRARDAGRQVRQQRPASSG